MSDLKNRVTDDMKSAMRSKEKLRLLTVRTILAAIKQQEVDTREDVDDTAILVILDKMCKQRRESITQFKKAGRNDLVAQEEAELEIIQVYLPEPMSDDELQTLIAETMATTGANSMQDMGKVMSIIKPKAQGRADMGKISGMIKAQLSS
ncbi:MAG TPA: GatB/YqeY domain-containing protein [Leucothrix mucor]|uniref:GatB/YqeY domain-containing protein n=1 Tax=Leucothrix mucor TaxID=45248 RepID=A0A7V2T2A8_LEUMU|nr:GatB/YqeY domain-containing protein [Leucothrix mucor]